jgi:hypothetical protein
MSVSGVAGTSAGTARADKQVRAHGTSTRLRRMAGGLSLLGAGSLTFAGFLVTPWEGSGGTGADLHTLASHATQAQVAALLLHFGYLLLVPVAFTLAYLARRRAGRLSATGLVLSVLGAGFSGLLVTDFFNLALAQQLPLATAVRVADAAKQLPMGAVLAKPTALAAIIGLVLLVVAAWRAGWISWWPTLVVFAGWVLAFSGTTLPRAGAGSALVFIGLAVIGWRVLRMTDAEWESGVPE